MNNKKGFTLIEILAVVVILTLIVLIVCPIIINQIETVKLKKFEISMDNVITQVEKYVISQRGFESEEMKFPNDKIKIKGTIPKGYLNINEEKKLEFLLEMNGVCAIKSYEDKDYEIDKEGCFFDFDKVVEFEKREKPYVFSVKKTGKYKIQLWGASSYPVSGKGAYTEGEILLKRGQKLYVYVGGADGTNGGGTARNGSVHGGGATDVRLVSGEWNDIKGLRSRIMVAAGGGSYGAVKYQGTSGGTFTSKTVTGGCGYGGNGAGQTYAGSYRGQFGIGGNGASYNGGHGGAGGGGWYGGGGSDPDYSADDDRGGAGGTSYIAGHPNMLALKSDLSNELRVESYFSVLDSIHYSGLYFFNTKVISGDNEMPDKENKGRMIGNSGDGKAIITYIDETREEKQESGIYVGKYYDYKYTGGQQVFVAPADGVYTFQLWGSASSPMSGRGAYTQGDIQLKKGTKIYLHVGGTRGYNGGGSSRNGTVHGGGATDIRLVSGTWNNEDGLKSRIMVAAGGGSYGGTSKSGTAGGGLTSTNSNDGCGDGGNRAGQTYGGTYRGKFGIGGDGASYSGGHGGAGGGGYYGGGGTNPDSSADDDKGGAGGSSFISGMENCLAITSKDNVEHKSLFYVRKEDSIHYSGYYFENYIMKSGNEEMPSYIDDKTIVGNGSSGYARVTIKKIKKIVDTTDHSIKEGKVYRYLHNYDLKEREFIVPVNGYYTIELWGASSYPVSGKGAYTKGDIYLTKGTKLYIYLGSYKGFNGGATARNGTIYAGGATDVRLVSGEWNNEVGLRSRIMVAAGGGSYGAVGRAGTAGGGLTSLTSNNGCGSAGTGAGQTYGGTNRGQFGKGGNGASYSGGHGGAGGGGYFGGGGAEPDYSGDDDKGGSGGSSYISGHNGCVSLLSQSSNELKNVASYWEDDIYHYSGHYFINTVMVSGDSAMPSIDFNGNITGNSGHGSARITIKKIGTETLPDNSHINLFRYTGEPQTFVVPKSGNYKIELWGASSYPVSGKGAYTEGEIYLTKGTKLYVYVGGRTGFNGGGTARNGTIYAGGATDVRLVSGEWNNEVGLRSRIMVAAGGGSYGANGKSGTAGGGLTSLTSNNGCGSAGTGAGQTYAGSNRGQFGIGGNGASYSYGHGGAGGGGYFGGGGAEPDSSQDDDKGGSGGSSYISGHEGCIAITSESSTTPKVSAYSTIEDSYHYSGYIFKNTKMLSGNEAVPDTKGGTKIGNTDNGYARIIYLD